MKAGWSRVRLGDLLDVQNGFAFDSKSFSPDGEMPLIRIRDLKEGVDTEAHYTGTYEKKYVVEAGDLLIGMDGEFGCYEWKGSSALLNQRVCRLQNFNNILLPRFLFYGINNYLKAIEEVTGFTTVKHLSSKQVLGIEFPTPPLPEQQRIVTILDEAFEGIVKATANAKQNLANAREVFESYLQSVFTSKGEGWTDKTIKDLTTILGDGLHGTPQYTIDGDYYFINGNNLSDGVIELKESTKRVSVDEFNKYKKNLTDRTILVSINGTLGNVAFYMVRKLF